MKKIALLLLVTFVLDFLPGFLTMPVKTTLAAGLADPPPMVVDDFESPLA